MSAIPPGWYPDPDDPQRRARWWTGADWSPCSVASRARRRRFPVVLALLVVLVGIAWWGALGLDAWMSLRGCGSIDPTDEGNSSVVVIRNDTAGPVVLADCRGGYCEPDALRRLDPGERVRVDAACGVSGPDMTSWRITDPTPATVGYISVDTPRKQDGLVYDVSRASRRRDQPTIPCDGPRTCGG